MTEKNPIEKKITQKTEKIHEETKLINKKPKHSAVAIITSVLLFAGIAAGLITILINIFSK
ncbi:hypothetical protein RD055328_06770 [Companilactobacillus sp. RD055328]|uniref:hypothetical protein n=1 Tax=Companilactobacillus sp. RD055328 TaxID=2916634 RepID=UPI001FC880E7|nr:hypothetical protein [Companilactobacillus sp. RD055328]GKQ42754.1 hypothetical protein RD055328_06770 [Companilactobacillus sp. RD055328]